MIRPPLAISSIGSPTDVLAPLAQRPHLVVDGVRVIAGVLTDAPERIARRGRERVVEVTSVAQLEAPDLDWTGCAFRVVGRGVTAVTLAAVWKGRARRALEG